ncbi:MAG: electron transfer flavoprotein subunit beta/FixA family protein [Burkholderiales bacterium]
MNIVVTVKQVVDPNLPPSYIDLDPSGKRIVSPFGVTPVMNGYDANALEAALKLKEAHGGSITAVCLGDDTSRNTLKRALAMGTDKAVLLNDPAWLNLDSAGTAHVLAAAIRKSGAADLVLCGRQASDTDGGQVLYWLAEALGLAVLGPVSKIEAVEAGGVVVQRLTEEGFQRVRVALPALLAISSEINEPRMPSLKGTMAAGRALISGWKASDLELAPLEPKVELRRLELQVRTTRATLIEGETAAAKGVALADKLRAEGLI